MRHECGRARTTANLGELGLPSTLPRMPVSPLNLPSTTTTESPFCGPLGAAATVAAFTARDGLGAAFALMAGAAGFGAGAFALTTGAAAGFSAGLGVRA